MAKRIHVIGAPGSGKTTLARQLAELIGVEATDLDVLAAVDAVERQEMCEQLAARPTWVCEGIYCGWTEPFLRAADQIVWLDLSPALSAYRIVSRHLRTTLRGDNPHKGMRLLAKFGYDATWRYFRRPVASDDDLAANPGANSRSTVEHRLRPYARSVIHVRSRAEARQLTDRLARI